MSDQITGITPSGQEASRPSTSSSQVSPWASPENSAVKQGVKRVEATERSVAKATANVSAQEAQTDIKELARRVNLTFDLFEIAAEYEIDSEANRITVTLRNTKTGKVIRRIPPDEFIGNAQRFRDIVGLMYNRSL